MAISLARCHREHLECELKKSDKLLNNITTEGISFKEYTILQYQELEREFPEIKIEGNEPIVNIMKIWYNEAGRRINNPPYEESTFKIMNTFFFQRVKYIQKPTKKNREELQKTSLQNMKKANLLERGYDFSYIINFEKALQKRMYFYLKNIIPEWQEKIQFILDEINSVVIEVWIKYYYELAEEARIQNEKLLRNILPESIVNQLKEKGKAPPEYHEIVTVGFTDFVGFSKNAAKMKPSELTGLLDTYFSQFDLIMEKYGLEKLKTIGDSYMFAGSLPQEKTNHAELCVKAAVEMQEIVKHMAKKDGAWQMRIGLHSGPVVAGIIGNKKFSYDIWGDTVNVASRMESAGEPGKVNISFATKELLPEKYRTTERGRLPVKNLGEMEMYFIQT